MSKKLPGVTRVDRRAASGRATGRRRTTRRKRSDDAAETTTDDTTEARGGSARSAAAETSADKTTGSGRDGRAKAGQTRRRRRTAPRKPADDTAERPAPDAARSDAQGGEDTGSQGGGREPESATAEPPPAAPAAPAVDPEAQRRRAAANGIIARYSGWTAAGGMLPIPIVDIVAVSAVQVRMIGALAAVYGVPFTRERGRAILSAIVGGVVPQVAASWLVGSFLKGMPGVALGAKLIGAGALSTAGTHVLGDLFVRHFETGGSLYGVDVGKMRRNFRDEMLSRVTPTG